MSLPYIDWQCRACAHEFTAAPMTREEHEICPWRWCPRCHSGSIPLAARLHEGYFSAVETRPPPD